MRKIFYVLILLFLLFSKNLEAQDVIPPSDIKWYSLNEAFELAQKEPRPILLDVYTDWCSWCKYMMKTTFANKGISNYINNNFYAARFDAETLDTIEFQGTKYVNRQIGRKKTHDLAFKLLDNKLSYPSIVYFDRQGKKTVIPGYKEPKDIEPMLVYFAENIGLSASLNDFYLNFMFTFPAPFEKDHSIFKVESKFRPDTLGEIDWVKPEEVINKNKKKKRPILLYLYTDWSISAKVMEKTTLGDRELAEKINENFFAVKINAADTSQIIFLGRTYKGTGVNLPNELTSYFLGNNLTMPAVVVFDENHKVLTKINGYLLKSQLIPLTEYFYNKSYKKMSFQEYMKTHMPVQP